MQEENKEAKEEVKEELKFEEVESRIQQIPPAASEELKTEVTSPVN
jgi:hypothetical protein